MECTLLDLSVSAPLWGVIDTESSGDVYYLISEENDQYFITEDDKYIIANKIIPNGE